jgi:alpha-tubulin suppressor-like RCC1 family protein
MSRCMARAQALTSRAGKARPFTSSRRLSATPPAGVAITGVPEAIASRITSPNVSVVEEKRKASALALAPAASPPTDGFFTGAAFVGAVPEADVPARIPWFSGWTDPAPTPAPIPRGIIAGAVRSPFRGLLPNVVVREVESAASTTTAANATFSLSADVGTALVELDGLPSECTAPAARAVTVQANATVTVELLVDCWPFAGATTLAPGSDFMCAVAKQGPHCWGANARGQLGIGTTSDSLLPSLVSGGYTSVTAGVAHACGRTSAADVRCWGAGDAGQLGNGALTDRLTPTPVAGGHAFLAVSAGDAHTCAVKGDGSVWCWGTNASGQLGTGTTSSSASPVPVASSVSFATVAAGAQHTCALDRGGAAWCWGAGTAGELGDGASTTRLEPDAVATAERFAALTVRGAHACGTTAAGAVRCWGENLDGALGDGTNAPRTSPTTVLHNGKLSTVAAGARHTCAVSTGAIALCWGANAAGQLGIGTTAPRNTPTAAPSATNLSQLSAGPDYTCGVTSGAVTGTDGNIVVISTRSLLCWGSNAGGQFGRGDRTSSLLPAGAAVGLTFR